MKAIKEGKDPNESNPKQEEKNEEEGVAALDPNDPEVQMIVGSDDGQPKPATVEDAPDEDDKLHPTHLAAYSTNSPAPVSAPTSPPPASAPAPEQVSPIAPTEPQTGPGSGSYFPDAPDKSHLDQDAFTLPSAPSMPAGGLPSAGAHDPTGSSLGIPSPSSHIPGMPPFASPPDAASTPQDFYRSIPPPPASASASAPTPPIVPPQQPYVPPQAPTSAASSHYSRPSQPTVPVATPTPSSQAPYNTSNVSTGYNTDDMAMAQAQKHAKWAISALNFEDVSTAVKELQDALAVLGAR